MKLNHEKATLVKSKEFTSLKYDIANNSVVFDIFRDRIYSLPEYIICQEIMSNAIDAHIEVGNPNPITIKLPNELDPTFYIRDYGPSISPERMLTYKQYGSSTKRANNKSIGAYGIGGKTPFAYTDTYIIISITEENGKLIKRQYTALIDESRRGEILLISEEETDEPQGTYISLTPSNKDFDKFYSGVKKVAYYWETKPEILGDPEWEWGTTELVKGSSWFLDLSKDRPFTGLIALIGNIPYTINLEEVFKQKPRKKLIDRYKTEEKNPKYGDFNINNRSINVMQAKVLDNLPLNLIFEIGDIRVTASRESLEYNDETIALICDKIQIFFSEFEKTVQKTLNKKKTIVSAYELHKKLAFLRSYSSLKWKDINLNNANLKFDSIQDVSVVKYERNLRLGFKKSRNKNQYWISERNVLVYNDKHIKNFPRGYLLTLFNNPKIENVFIVSLLEENSADTLQKLQDRFKWHLLPVIKLSSIKKTPTAKKSKANKETPKICKYNPYRHKWEAVTTLPENSTYVIKKGAYLYADSDYAKKFITKDLNKFTSMKAIYLVPYELRDSIPETCISLKESIKQYLEKIDNPNTTNLTTTCFLFNPRENFVKKLNLPEDSLFLQYAKKKFERSNNFISARKIKEFINFFDLKLPKFKELERLIENLRERYPLLVFLPSSLPDTLSEEIKSYILKKDNEYNEET